MAKNNQSEAAEYVLRMERAVSKAYQAIAKLQDENKSLKERIRELEEAQRQDEGVPSISSKARVKTKRGVESLARSVKKKKKAEEEEEEAVVLERAISISKEVDDVFKDWSDDDDAEEAESCVLGAQDNPCELPSLSSREARPVTEDGADLLGQSNSAAEEDGAADSRTPAVNIEDRSEVFEREEVMGLEENESDYEDEDKANEVSATQLGSSPSSSTPSDRTQECLQTQGRLLSSSQLLWLESLAPEVFARELFQYFKRLYSRLSTPSDLTSLLTRASSTSILGLLATFMIKSNYGMQRLLTVWEHFYARFVAEVKKERPYLTLPWLCAGDNLSNPSSKKEKFSFSEDRQRLLAFMSHEIVRCGSRLGLEMAVTAFLRVVIVQSSTEPHLWMEIKVAVCAALQVEGPLKSGDLITLYFPLLNRPIVQSSCPAWISYISSDVSAEELVSQEASTTELFAASSDETATFLRLGLAIRRSGLWNSLSELTSAFGMCPALERCVTFSKQYPQIISTLHKWSVTRDDLWPANLFQSIFWDFKSIDDPAEISFGQTSLIDIENSLLTKMSTSWAKYLNDQYYDANVWALWPACFEASSGDYDGSRGGWAFTSSGQAVELTTLLVSAIVRCRAALVSVGIQIADHELTPPADLPISQTAAAYLGTSATPEAVYGCAKVLDLLLKKRDSINLASSEHAQEWDPIKQLLLENFTLLTCAAFERVIFFGMLSARALVRVAASDSSLMLPLAIRRHLVGALRLLTCARWHSVDGASLTSDILTGIDLLSTSAMPNFLAQWKLQLSMRVPVLLINLKRRCDRFKLFMKSAALNNILAIRVQAVDGNVDDISGADVGATWNSHLNSRFDSSCKANDTLPLSPSERGCAASHIKVWRIIAQFGSSPNIFRSSSVEINAFSLSSLSHQLRVRVRDGNLDNSWFIICEDDAKLVSSSLDANFLGTISKIVALLPLDCDICYLGHTIPRCAQNEIVSVRKAFFRPSYLWQLHAYMIRPTTARVLLSCVPVAEPVDNFLARLIYEKRIVAYALKKQLFKQKGGSFKERCRTSDVRHSGRVGQY